MKKLWMVAVCCISILEGCVEYDAASSETLSLPARGYTDEYSYIGDLGVHLDELSYQGFLSGDAIVVRDSGTFDMLFASVKSEIAPGILAAIDNALFDSADLVSFPISLTGGAYIDSYSLTVQTDSISFHYVVITPGDNEVINQLSVYMPTYAIGRE